MHKITKIIIGAFLLLTTSCDQFGESSQKQAVPNPNRVESLLKKVTEYEIAHQKPIDEQGPSWRLCAFYIGTMEAYLATKDSLYRDVARRWAQANNWQYRRPRHADYQCIGQAYLELHLLNPALYRVKATQTIFDNILSDPRPGDVAWNWADALFMAPPVLSRLAEATGDTTYLNFMNQKFWEASAPLYDSTHHLYYRDERYVDRQTEHGKDVFWARGNGWVLAGLARILQFLPPDHPSHGKFVNRFRNMAAAVAQLQSNDGFWRTSLLDPEEYPAPESSGTGLFCYALAWGIDEGYLNVKRYRPVVFKAWHALTEATNDEGRVGWVQEPGSRPGLVSPDDTGAYGAGAFLMAGSEVLMMVKSKGCCGHQKKQ